MPEFAPDELPPRRQLVGNVLSSAVRLWLKSQVTQAEDLQLHVEGGDRQILTGHIPRVVASAHSVVFQGFHLSRISITGSNIRMNLGQVLRGKPFRLLAIVPIQGEAVLEEAALNASLQSPLLAAAVTDFLINMLRATDSLAPDSDSTLNLQNPQVRVHPDRLTLTANLISPSGAATPILRRNPCEIAIRSGIALASGHELLLRDPQWLTHPEAKRGLPLKDLEGYAIDLGSDIDIRELHLEAGQIVCRGQINVIPT